MNSAPHRTNRELDVAVVVVVRVDVVRVEVQVEPVVRIVLRGRPVVAVVAKVVDIATVAVTRGRKEKNRLQGLQPVLLLMQEGTFKEPICTYDSRHITINNM